MSAPDPFVPGEDRVVVNGKQYLVMSRHPHLDSWRYVGQPVDLAGAVIHFDHEDALPVRKPAIAPSARGLLAGAGLDPGQFDNELSIVQEVERPLTPLEELIAAALECARYGMSRWDNLHGAAIAFEEGQ